MNRWMRTALVGIAAIASIAATGNWLTTIERTAGGHRLGNPAAPVKLMEFVSYTCPHCGHFEMEAGAPLKQSYVQPGKVQVELRHIVRDPVDMVAAVLANCGPKEKFFRNHTAFMQQQDVWLAKAQASALEQRRRWAAGSFPVRAKAIAGDLGFYDLMAGNGYSRAAVDACLSDEARARSIAELSSSNSTLYGVNATPSFAIDGKLLADVHDWNLLQKALAERF